MVYYDWCGIIRGQMYSELPYKHIKIGVCSNKKRRFGKPWWSNNLTELWNTVCETERKWLRCTTRSDKSKFKTEYVASRKHFDREVQRTKNLYWCSFQNQLVEECNSGEDNFWRTIGRLGDGQSQKRRVPMEVVLEDGSISRESTAVLEKWKRDFSFADKY